MPVHIAIDLGSISVKAAVFSSDSSDNSIFEKFEKNALFESTRKWNDPTSEHREHRMALTTYQRIAGSPLKQARILLNSLVEIIGEGNIARVVATGSGAGLLKSQMNLPVQNEFRALARSVELLYPDIRTIFEMGGENSKYLLLNHDDERGRVGIEDYSTNGDCAAGTGAFLDQQANRLRFKVEQIGEIVTSTKRSPKIAGRCSVFAKSDMIHAQQKGFTPEEILKGLCEAVARNFKGAITKGKEIEKKVAFIGGVAANRGVVEALEIVFGWEPGTLFVPAEYSHFAAIGAAALSEEESERGLVFSLADTSEKAETVFARSNRLTMDKVVLLRDRMKEIDTSELIEVRDTFLGIDIGSVSTNLVVIDEERNVLKEIYLRTEARPIEVVGTGLKIIQEELGDKIRICGVGTTGSGRELIGELVGADTINDEITAHKTGAAFISNTILEKNVDTIFEIGGQDSKFISLEEGIVVDFAMNEACAAGTGSFLEERAQELGIQIKGEFSETALGSPNPVRLGERCTVFMEQDVNSTLQRGAELQDVVAGLAYSIATNYLNRVVRARKVGEVIFFQGGTAYNDSVAAAFSCILDKEIIVPPFNGVMGALGVALLARDKMLDSQDPSSFRGFDLDQVDYGIREFTCKGCTNYCQMQEFTVEGERTYWGDKCSDRYRKAVKCDHLPVIENLPKLRHSLLFDGYDPDKQPAGPTVGIPFSMSFYEWMPFWLEVFGKLGIRVKVSEQTTNNITNLGLESVVSEPCFPIQVAHGHIRWLIENECDFLFVPNNISAPGGKDDRPSFYCPWNQTLPYVTASAPFIDVHADKMIVPTLWFNHGEEATAKEVKAALDKVGIKKKTKDVLAAVAAGFVKQAAFKARLIEEGRKALETIGAHDEHGIILLGRPYNIYDKGINIDLAEKLRTYYGVNVVPLDFLELDKYNDNIYDDSMFWNYGKKIMAAAKFAAGYPKLHLIYVTNFKCGPDSYIKHFVSEVSGRPFLTLQYDGHNNDAGMMTRCEAYLDSKGVLRRWGTAQQEMAGKS